MDKIIVSIVGGVGIGFVYWFFLIKKEKATAIADSGGPAGSPEIDIIVEGGYAPEVIEIPKGKTTKVNFIRKDPSSCLEEVVVSDFKIRKYLPLNQKITIELIPLKAGEFVYSCGMSMHRGKIIVK